MLTLIILAYILSLWLSGSLEMLLFLFSIINAFCKHEGKQKKRKIDEEYHGVPLKAETVCVRGASRKHVTHNNISPPLHCGAVAVFLAMRVPVYVLFQPRNHD